MTWRMKRGRKEGRATRSGGSESKIWKDMVGVGSLGGGREAGGTKRERRRVQEKRKRTEDAAARAARLP